MAQGCAYKSVCCDFTQLFTIHGFIQGQLFPLVFALLPGKTQDIYARLFTIVVGLFGALQNQVATIVSDFESGLIAATSQVFPGVVHRGCYFHYAQALWRKVQEFGLTPLYRNPS